MIVGLAALYKNNPLWNEQTIKNAFYHKNLPIPESFQSASSYFKETFNYPRVGVNTCNVVVHEDHRMRGIGDYLVKNLIRISGRSPLELNVLSENEAAIRLYHNLDVSLFLLQIFLDAPLYPYDASQEDKGERREDNQIVRYIAEPSQDIHSEEGAASKELAEEGYDQKDQAVAGSVGDSVEE